MIFQIAGYPRSGTAWLSTMFNLAPEVMAFHELAMTDKNWKRTILETVRYGKIVGDLGTYQYFPKAVVEDIKRVFIWQNPWDSRDKCQEEIGLPISNDTVNLWISMSNEWRYRKDPMIVMFTDLFNIDTLEEIWTHCLGEWNVRFPRQKVEQLLHLNIQFHDPSKYLVNPDVIARMAELL